MHIKQTQLTTRKIVKNKKKLVQQYLDLGINPVVACAKATKGTLKLKLGLVRWFFLKEGCRDRYL